MPSSHQSTTFFAPGYLQDVERYLARIASILLHTFLFLLIIRFFVAEPGLTDGISMDPTIRDHTPLVIEKLSLLARAPQRFDIVQHIEPLKKQTFFVKRIIGLPGETIRIKNNAISVVAHNAPEQKLSEPYLRPDSITDVPYGAKREFVLSDNEYFVMGDNRQNSNDSRAYGPVHRKLITGKVLPIVLR